MSDSRLLGRVALITGASRGIGEAVARLFAAEGADLILPARQPEALVGLQNELAEFGRAVLIPKYDLTDRRCFPQMAQQIDKRFGRLDILVANAGVLGPLSKLSEIDDESWDHAFDINLSANYRLLKNLDSLLRTSKAARIVFATTGATRSPGRPELGPYTISKYALEAMAKTYAAETADTQIRINLINPGPTRTKMRATICPQEDPLTVKTPAEVGGFFLDLCLTECPYSGEILDVVMDEGGVDKGTGVTAPSFRMAVRNPS
ncbi:MAG: SDR family NAD(P)-dependent oxidoreductase [Alphaproteobacteria bacterium]|nr:SDR family NAD(P)-dependent oxidoreductase [Alphaproteobacteria bacterium]